MEAPNYAAALAAIETKLACARSFLGDGDEAMTLSYLREIHTVCERTINTAIVQALHDRQAETAAQRAGIDTPTLGGTIQPCTARIARSNDDLVHRRGVPPPDLT